MSTLYNIARMTTVTTGTGTITLGSAVASFLTFALAGVTDGMTVAYLIEDGNGTGREVGTGVYTSSGTTLTRNVTNSTNSGSAISLSGTAQVALTALAADITNKTGDTMAGALNWTTATTIASSSTVAIGAANTNYIIISGTSTITAFDTLAQGAYRWCRFSGAATLTYNATTLILPGVTTIAATAGDWFLAVSEGSGNWRVPFYQKANGKAIIAPAFTDITSQAAGLAAAPFGPFTSIASATTTDLSTVATIGVSVTGTTTITSFGTGVSLFRIGKFAGALTLTHNATSLILPGAANITTAAGDRFIALSDGSGNWTVVAYTKASGTPVVLGGITGVVDIRTASATMTIPTGAAKLKVTLVGGGGGGGGCAAASAEQSTAGPGGPAGALVKYLSGLTAGNTLALSIGAAGTAGSAGNNNGGNGGDTTLSSGSETITTLTASKGTGGGGAAADGDGTAGTAGTGTNGDLNVAGGTSSGVTTGASGLGFSSGQIRSNSSGAGTAGTGYGGAGSGGLDTAGISRAGGAGTAGCAIFEWYP